MAHKRKNNNAHDLFYFNSEITKYMLFSIYYICAAEAMLIISNFIRI